MISVRRSPSIHHHANHHAPSQGQRSGWSMDRRTFLAVSGAAAAGLLGASARVGAQSPSAASSTPAPSLAWDEAAGAVNAILDAAMSEYHLKAVIARVTVDGRDLVTTARGEAMNGVPATPDMHFRNGAVAISYVSTALLILVDEGVVTLEDTLDRWLPDLPDAAATTLRMLANMTAGYPDYVNTDEFSTAAPADPFREWTPEDLIAISLAQGRTFAPGENWAYSHTNYVILGLAMEKITGQPLDEVLRERVLEPLGLTETASFYTPQIPEPVLNAYTSERRKALGIPAGTRFYEESTFWDPSWTISRGAIQTTNITDMTASAIAFGEGTLLTPASHTAQTEKALAGFGSDTAGCVTCRALTEQASYGLGIWLVGDWLLQNPSFNGYGAFMAYLPSRRIAIATSVTVAEDGFDGEGKFLTSNASQPIGAAIAALLAPESPISGRLRTDPAEPGPGQPASAVAVRCTLRPPAGDHVTPSSANRSRYRSPLAAHDRCSRTQAAPAVPSRRRAPGSCTSASSTSISAS